MDAKLGLCLGGHVQAGRTGGRRPVPVLFLASLKTFRQRLVMGGWVLKRTGPWSTGHQSPTRHQSTEEERLGEEDRSQSSSWLV